MLHERVNLEVLNVIHKHQLGFRAQNTFYTSSSINNVGVGIVLGPIFTADLSITDDPGPTIIYDQLGSEKKSSAPTTARFFFFLIFDENLKEN